MGFVEGLGSNQKNANIVIGIPGLDSEKWTAITAYNIYVHTFLLS